MEGDLAAKARYQYIAGQWKGGDVSSNLLYNPCRERQYSKILLKLIDRNGTDKLTIINDEIS